MTRFFLLRLSPGVPPHPKALAQARQDADNPALDSLRLQLLSFSRAHYVHKGVDIDLV